MHPLKVFGATYKIVGINGMSMYTAYRGKLYTRALEHWEAMRNILVLGRGSGYVEWMTNDVLKLSVQVTDGTFSEFKPFNTTTTQQPTESTGE